MRTKSGSETMRAHEGEVAEVGLQVRPDAGEGGLGQ